MKRIIEQLEAIKSKLNIGNNNKYSTLGKVKSKGTRFNKNKGFSSYLSSNFRRGYNNITYVLVIGILIFVSTLFVQSGGIFFVTQVLPIQLKSLYANGQVFVENDWNSLLKILNKNDVEFEDPTRFEVPEGIPNITEEQYNTLMDFDSMEDTYFIADGRTLLSENLFDVVKGISYDFTITPSATQPKVLIFHTHANEFFIDSDLSKGLDDGVIALGVELQRILKEDYGIESVHCKDEFDMINGEGNRVGAYERMDAPIKKILDENPSIEIALDIHRDGVADNVHLVVEYDGINYAKLMFVNGITTLLQDGELVPVENLDNPFLQETLAFSLQMQLEAENQFPNLNRKIFLNPYRLSTHMLPRSALVEVGAQTNTKEEAMNSMELLAKILTDVVLEEEENINNQ